MAAGLDLAASQATANNEGLVHFSTVAAHIQPYENDGVTGANGAVAKSAMPERDHGFTQKLQFRQLPEEMRPYENDGVI